MKHFSIMAACAVLALWVGCASTGVRHSDMGGTGGCQSKQGGGACEALQANCRGSYNEWDSNGEKACECCGEKQENPKYKY